MASLTTELLGRLRPMFTAEADPERSASARRYMRDLFPFFGIPAPGQRRIARTATAGLRAPSEAELASIARACWDEQEREWQYFACGYLRRHIGVGSPALLSTVEWLIETKSWWDTVDALASRTVGPLVRKHRELAGVMDGWIASDDIWIARTAILHQLTYKDRTDAARLFGYCRDRAADKEFFIRKAIGWALREYSKTDAEAVRSFVTQNRSRLSGLSRTEALKWLDRRAGHRSRPAVES